MCEPFVEYRCKTSFDCRGPLRSQGVGGQRRHLRGTCENVHLIHASILSSCPASLQLLATACEKSQSSYIRAMRQGAFNTTRAPKGILSHMRQQGFNSGSAAATTPDVIPPACWGCMHCGFRFKSKGGEGAHICIAFMAK